MKSQNGYECFQGDSCILVCLHYTQSTIVDRNKWTQFYSYNVSTPDCTVRPENMDKIVLLPSILRFLIAEMASLLLSSKYTWHMFVIRIGHGYRE